MRLSIDEYIDAGDLKNERIAFKVKSDCNLKFFAAHLSRKLPSGGFYNRPSETYWFTPQDVKAGDWIVLYTKNGTNSIKENESGSTTFFYYWGLESTIFNKPTDGIILAEIDTWDTKYNE